jgi:hypothetical protein
MWEAEDGGAQSGRVTRLPNWYFGGDLFGPLFHNLSLHQWAGIFRQAGLFLRASLGAHRALRPMVASGATRLFMSCPRAELCELLDLMHPSSFHQLLLTRQPAVKPPWQDAARLSAWRPVPTGLYRVACQRPDRRMGSRLVTRLKSRALGTQFEWPMPRWEVEILRRGNGATPIRELLREQGQVAPAAELGEQMFLLHQFAVLNLFPP